ncbi:hypothetical protein ACFWFI_34375 [Streptomyces sp. NPDC060209]|uniref:hypothetical protein n=1 Tax=Streptomyces sp. NPDC060209 TaxID=3347073 RepID=UPI00365DAB14
MTSSAEPSARVAVLAPLPFSLYFIWRIFQNPFIILGERGVSINNAYSEFFIPYQEIEGCGAGPGLVINTKRSGKIFSAAFDSSLFGKSVRREIEKEIAVRIKAPKHDSSVKFEKGYTMGAPEVIGPMLSFVLFVVAISL